MRGRGEEEEDKNDMDDDDDGGGGDNNNNDPVNQPMPLHHTMQNHTHNFLHLSNFEVTAKL